MKKKWNARKWWLIGVGLAVLGIMVAVLWNRPVNVSAEDLMEGVIPGEVALLEDLCEGSVDVTDFGIRLFQTAMKEGENTLISPLSVLYALAMTANGAEGETLAQMEQVLGMPVEDLNAYLHTYVVQLPEGEKYKLSLANSIWFTNEDTFQVEQDFLQTNGDYYGAQIYKRTFDDAAVGDMNAWVKQNTDGMIPEIVDRIPEDAVMYLVNALAFEAEWSDIYEEGQVREGTFTTEEENARRVEYMYSGEYAYLEDEQATGFIKYYKDGKYAFVALLPNSDISVAEYVNSLTGERVQELLANVESVLVSTAIPKFEAEYDTELSQVLMEMGIKDAFHILEADFSKLGHTSKPGGNIFINRVLHKTFINVGEKGTKAGAATAVEMLDNGGSAYAQKSKVVYLDRPFAYMLIDTENNLPFFIGTLMDVQ